MAIGEDLSSLLGLEVARLDEVAAKLGITRSGARQRLRRLEAETGVTILCRCGTRELVVDLVALREAAQWSMHISRAR